MGGLTYTRWYVLSEMKRGRLLAVPSWGLRVSRNRMPHFLTGMSEDVEHISRHTARAIIARGEVSLSSSARAEGVVYELYRLSTHGRERIQNRQAYSPQWWDWLGGKYRVKRGAAIPRLPFAGVRSPKDP